MVQALLKTMYLLSKHGDVHRVGLISGQCPRRWTNTKSYVPYCIIMIITIMFIFEQYFQIRCLFLSVFSTRKKSRTLHKFTWRFGKTTLMKSASDYINIRDIVNEWHKRKGHPEAQRIHVRVTFLMTTADLVLWSAVVILYGQPVLIYMHHV